MYMFTCKYSSGETFYILVLRSSDSIFQKPIHLIVTYGQVPLKRGPIYHDMTHDTAITVAESESDSRIVIDTPYLTTDELWVSIVCQYYNQITGQSEYRNYQSS